MKPLPIRLRLFGWWPTRTEWRIMLHDARMRRLGVCNETPDMERGGYSHWRCQLDIYHVGPHRYRNYVWSTLRPAPRYDPLPIAEPMPNGDPQVPGFGMSFAQRRAGVKRIRRLSKLYGETVPAYESTDQDQPNGSGDE